MRCVSYTRYVSSMPEREVPANIISLQNQRIEEYARNNGLHIEKKYSDRKNDWKAETAFKQLKAAGMRREFDMLLIDSFYRLGINISAAKNLLRDVFYPAGIGFAIAEDDFCSTGKTLEELDRYIARKYADHRTKTRWYANMEDRAQGHFSVHDEKYGYLLSEDRRELIVDEEVAPIIRELFQMMADGLTMKAIAQTLNEKGYESPEAHLRRVGKKNRVQKQNDYWTANTIKSVCRCRDYMGTMRRKIHDEYVDLPVPVIIDEELFRKAEEVRGSHNHGMPGFRPQPNALKFIIFDRESGNHLICRAYCRNSDDRNFCLGSKAQDKRIPYRKTVAEVRRLLEKEVIQARDARTMLSSECGRILYESRKQSIVSRMRNIMKGISDLAIERIEVHGQHGDGKEDELLADNELRLQELESDFQQAMDDRERLDKAFFHNPWVELYESIEIGEELENMKLKKWIDRVWVHDFKEITLDVKHKEWKEMIVADWREKVNLDG